MPTSGAKTRVDWVNFAAGVVGFVAALLLMYGVKSLGLEELEEEAPRRVLALGGARVHVPRLRSACATRARCSWARMRAPMRARGAPCMWRAVHVARGACGARAVRVPRVRARAVHVARARAHARAPARARAHARERGARSAHCARARRCSCEASVACARRARARCARGARLCTGGARVRARAAPDALRTRSARARSPPGRRRRGRGVGSALVVAPLRGVGPRRRGPGRRPGAIARRGRGAGEGAAAWGGGRE